jgi:hypothetical protein
VERVTSANEQILDDIPMWLLLDLPRTQSNAFRALLIRFLWKRGGELLKQVYYGQSKGLQGAEILLDRYFTDDSALRRSSRGEIVMAYLSPLLALLEGVAAQGLEFEQAGRIPQDYRLEVSLASVMFDVFQLPLKAKAYADVCDKMDLTRDIAEAVRDKVFTSKKILECLPALANCAFMNQVFRRSVGVLEEEILSGESGAAQSGALLYFSLLKGFGESVHQRSFFTAHSKTHGQHAMNTILVRCIALTFLDQEPLHVNHYIVSFLDATFLFLLESLRNDQYSLPDSLALLPSILKKALSKRASYICHPEFFLLIERYLRLIEEQVMNILTAFNAKSISKEDLHRLCKSPQILESLNKIADSWGLEVWPMSHHFVTFSACFLFHFISF